MEGILGACGWGLGKMETNGIVYVDPIWKSEMKYKAWAFIRPYEQAFVVGLDVDLSMGFLSRCIGPFLGLNSPLGWTQLWVFLKLGQWP